MSKRNSVPKEASTRSRSFNRARWAMLAGVILALGGLASWQLIEHAPVPAAASASEYQVSGLSATPTLGSGGSDEAGKKPISVSASPTEDREAPAAKPKEVPTAKSKEASSEKSKEVSSEKPKESPAAKPKEAPPSSSAQPKEHELDKSPSAASQDMKKEKALNLEAKSETVGQMEVRIVDFTSVKAKARGVGEIAGDALAVQLSIKNSGSKALDLSRATMLLFAGEDMLPATELDNSGAVSLPAKLDVGKSATGSFIFTVPDSWKSKVTVQFIADPTSNILIFEGEPRLERSTQ